MDSDATEPSVNESWPPGAGSDAAQGAHGASPQLDASCSHAEDAQGHQCQLGLELGPAEKDGGRHLRVLHILSDCPPHSDRVAEALQSLGDDISSFALAGDAPGAILVSAGWETLAGSLISSDQWVVVSVPCATFLKGPGDGAAADRVSARDERDGAKFCRGEVKERLRLETLCIKRAADIFRHCRTVGVGVALISPVGQGLVYNPAAHHALKGITEECETLHGNVLTDEFGPLDGLSIFSNVPFVVDAFAGISGIQEALGNIRRGSLRGLVPAGGPLGNMASALASPSAPAQAELSAKTLSSRGRSQRSVPHNDRQLEV